MMKYGSILFDLDGTLTDSGEGIMSSAVAVFEQMGLPVPEKAELRKMVGPPLSTSFPALGVPQERVEEAKSLYREQYNNHGGKFMNSVYPGIETMLQGLQKAGCKLYVATSKPEKTAREVLEHFRLTGYFDIIAGASFDHSRENKSDVLRYLLQNLSAPEKAVMVGDTKWDILGAHELNLPCVAVRWGYGTEESIKEAGADAVVDTPEQLLSLLTQNEREA